MTQRKRRMDEPTLEDLLGDEIMVPVMRSAGVDAEELRARLRETARRLADRGTSRPPPRRSCRVPALCCSA